MSDLTAIVTEGRTVTEKMTGRLRWMGRTLQQEVWVQTVCSGRRETTQGREWRDVPVVAPTAEVAS